MNKPLIPLIGRPYPILVAVALVLLGAGAASGQTTFTVNNLGPIPSTGATVSITAPDTLYQDPGPVSGNFTPVTIDTNLYFSSTSAGASNPGFQFNGIITGASIAAGTTMPISYNFTLSKNESVGTTVNWSLVFAGSENSTPITIGSGTFTATGAASQAFSGVYNNYDFINGSSASGGTTSTFTASLELSYNTGIPTVQPLVTVSMIDGGFGGQGITLGSASSAVPEPSTCAVFAGLAAFGLAFWRKRKA
ncbi:MAG: PEP-CTERM sorting domain-containing protein [Opitutales bacterium]